MSVIETEQGFEELSLRAHQKTGANGGEYGDVAALIDELLEAATDYREAMYAYRSLWLES